MNKWVACLFVTAQPHTGVTAAMIGTQAMLVQQGGVRDSCCKTSWPSVDQPRVYNQSFSSLNVRTTDAQAAALVESSFVARDASRPVGAAARTSLAFCVIGQARGFNPVRPLGKVLSRGGVVDVFAVIELDCMPHTCAKNALARTKRWAQSQRVRNAIITVNNTPISAVGATTSGSREPAGTRSRHPCPVAQRGNA